MKSKIIKNGKKRCPKCGEWVLFEEYQKNKNGRYSEIDKIQNCCSTCQIEYATNYYLSNHDYCKERNNLYRYVQRTKKTKEYYVQNLNTLRSQYGIRIPLKERNYGKEEML